MSPAKLQTLLHDAVALHRAGKLAEAEALYGRVRTAAPKNFDAWHLSGLAAQQGGDARTAADRLERALRLNPASGLCEMRLGAARLDLGELAMAERHLRRAVAREPGMPEAWCNLGVALKRLGQLPEAQASFQRAIALQPAYAEAHGRLGALLSETEGFSAATTPLRRAAELEPHNPTSLANLGVALTQSGVAETALGLFERALAIDPDHALALTGRALAHQETYEVARAVEDYGQVLARYPDNHHARSGRLLALHYLDGRDREEIFREHLSFDQAVGQPIARALPNRRDPDRTLRLGFVSPDLRQHSVAYFLEPLLGHLDAAQFEVVLYHDHHRVDAMSARLRQQAAGWRQLAGLSDDAVESLVRQDAPDVLVDLAGHTGINRLPLFARRLAPVQITYLGYPDTTGLRAMDFRLVDGIVDPEGESDRFHTERLVRFAPTAWAYAPPADAPEPEPAAGNGVKRVTFGCFNMFAKISASTLRAWSRILGAVPGSRLLLKGHGANDPGVAGRLHARLAESGIEPGRVELLARTPDLRGHLSHYHHVDVVLDTFPYHGTTTTCEALWMGRPVITLAGDRHASRVGASLLTAVGRREWIARDWDEYVAAAARLATDPAELQIQRQSLRDDLRASPLLDHSGQAARFGAAVRTCWRQWCESGQRSAA